MKSQENISLSKPPFITRAPGPRYAEVRAVAGTRMGTEMRPLLETLLQTRASCSEGGCWLAAAGTGVTQINDGALMPNKPNDISSLNNECCHAPHTQPSAGYLIGLRSGYWRPAARLQVLVQVSQCRVRDNDVLMSLSVSSTRRHCARAAASRGGLALLTAAAGARTVMEVTGSRVTVTRPRSRRSRCS